MKRLAWALTLVTSFGCGAGGGEPVTVSQVPGKLGSADASPPSPAATPGPRYDVPTCPLRYEIHTRESSDGRFPMELESFIALDVEGGGGRMGLVPVTTAWMKVGRHRPYAVADTGHTRVELVTDGRTWSEADGKRTLLMHAMGTQGGLELLFPPLPELVPSTTEWRLEREAGTVLQSGVGFNSSQAAPTWTSGKTLPTTFEVKATREAGDVVVLRSRAREDESLIQPGADFMGTAIPSTSMKVTGEIRMEHVFSQKGRLLRATVDRDVVISTSYGSTPSDPARFVRHTDAHLVATCDGPIEAKLPIVRTREDRAIEAVGEVGVAIYKDEKDKALARLSPSLRKRHGDVRLWGAIQKYRQARGQTAWPIPLMVQDEDVQVLDAQRVEVRTRSNVPKPGATNTVTPVELRFIVRTDGASFVVESIMGTFTIEKGEVFEASDKRVFP